MGNICSAEHATHPTDMASKNAYVSTDSKSKQQSGLNNPKLDPYIEPNTQFDPISRSGRRSISSTAPICVQVGSGTVKSSGQFCSDEDPDISVSRSSGPRNRGTETNHTGTTHNSLYLFGSPDPASRSSVRNTANMLQQQQQQHQNSQMRPPQVSTDNQRQHIREMLVQGVERRRGRNSDEDDKVADLAPPQQVAGNPNRKSTGIPQPAQNAEAEVPFGARADLAARRRYSVDSYSINMKKQLKNKKISKDDFQFVQVLGRGHFAEVREWVHKSTGVHYAVKVIDKSSSESMECIHEELQILMRAGNHPNVVQLIDSFEDSSRFYIVMELCKGGDLFTHIVSEGKYSEARAVVCCRQLASALRHIHRNGVTHRDLKPENILLSSRQPDALLKLADFGLSKIINDRSPMKTVCGTWAYCAPEVIAHKPYTRAVDNWTLGVLTFILLSGYHPFDVFGDLPEPQLLEKIAKCEYDFNDPAWVGVGEEPKRLIRGLLQLDPTKRMSLDDFLQSPWIRGDGASSELYEVPEKLKKLQARNDFRAVVLAKVHAKKIKDFARRSVEKSRRASMGAAMEKGGNALFMAAILNAAKARTTAHSEADDGDAMMSSEPSSPTGYGERESGRDAASPITATRRLLLQLDRKTPIEPASQPTSPALFGRSLNVHVPRDDMSAPHTRTHHGGW